MKGHERKLKEIEVLSVQTLRKFDCKRQRKKADEDAKSKGVRLVFSLIHTELI